MKRPALLIVFAFLIVNLGDVTSHAEEHPVIATAKAMAKSLGEFECRLLHEERQDNSFAAELFSFSHKEDYEDQPRDYQLVRVPCWLAAYNQGDAYVLIDSYGEASLVSFAVPRYSVTYADGDTSEKVKSIKITGYGARMTVGLSHFDPETRQISEFLKSRGLGDASTSAVWQFQNGSFNLLSYSVDASYDGEINQQVLIDFGDAQ